MLTISLRNHRRNLLTEVVDGIFLIRKTWGCNVYFIDQEPPLLIDAGFPVDSTKIMKILQRYDIPPAVIATHYHLDHVGALKVLAQEMNARLYAHELDALVIEGVKPYEIFKIDPLRKAYYKLLAPLFRYEFVEVDVKLKDRDKIDFHGGIEVIHVPGHTNGSIALYLPSRNLLFSGDTLRNENCNVSGPPPNFSTCLEEAYKSIYEKILPLDFDILLPGHGEPIIGGAKAKVESLFRKYGRS